METLTSNRYKKTMLTSNIMVVTTENVSKKFFVVYKIVFYKVNISLTLLTYILYTKTFLQQLMEKSLRFNLQECGTLIAFIRGKLLLALI